MFNVSVIKEKERLWQYSRLKEATNKCSYLSLEWIMHWKGENATKGIIRSTDKIKM